jgi:hypothetical protein
MLAACAKGGEMSQSADASITRLDSSGGNIDSSLAGIDAPTGCTATNVLANGSFDVGDANWTATPIMPTDAIISTAAADGGLDPQSPEYRVWLGGYEAAPENNQDSLVQDVMIPAGTVSLEFTGYHYVETEEPDADAFDTSDVLLLNGNQVIETLGHFDDNGATTGWEPFTKTITQNLAGQTVRIKLLSAGDGLYVTNFFYDTFALSAKPCM